MKKTSALLITLAALTAAAPARADLIDDLSGLSFTRAVAISLVAPEVCKTSAVGTQTVDQTKNAMSEQMIFHGATTKEDIKMALATAVADIRDELAKDPSLCEAYVKEALEAAKSASSLPAKQ